jgi:glycolate oxidase FAD binding subunit
VNPQAWSDPFARALGAALGEDALDPASGCLRPRDREGARRAVELLHRHGLSWRPVGRGGDPGEGLHLSTERLSGVMDLWREDLVARLGAGTSLRQAQRELAREGFRLPATAIEPEHETLGRLFATGDRGWRSGPNRALRECTLGLTAIDGVGRVLKGGGRVVKNVAGYDLVRLHHGAEGAFGVLTDLVVKLEALPESGVELTLPCTAAELPQRLAADRAPARDLDPVAQLWCDPGASRVLGLAPEGALLLQVEGWEQSVQAWRSARSVPTRAISIEDLLGRLRAAAAWQGRWQVGLRRAVEEGAPALERWRRRGLGIWMVVDLLAGGALLFAEEAGGGLAEALGGLIALEGRVHSGAGFPLPGGMCRAAPSPQLDRLKAAFDPAGVLPPTPGPLEREP